MNIYFPLFFLFIFNITFIFSQKSQTFNTIPDFSEPIIRFIRIYGERSELDPPVIVISDERTAYSVGLQSEKLIVEFDVASRVPPNMFARFVHCSFDWKEDENIFINEVTGYRTSNIIWESAPISSRYYNFRGKIIIPNEQVKFKYSGNWKVKLYDYSKPEQILAEARFFVVNPIVNVELRFYSDFYQPERNVTASAFDIEALVIAPQKAKLIENFLHSVVFYRNHRWYEPLVVSMYSFSSEYYKYDFSTSIFGFLSNGKVFRIGQIPAENGYRVLDLSNLVLYPSINAPIRLPMSDIRRRGSFSNRTNSGRKWLSSP